MDGHDIWCMSNFLVYDLWDWYWNLQVVWEEGHERKWLKEVNNGDPTISESDHASESNLIPYNRFWKQIFVCMWWKWS